jgi:hypothetical protein
MLNRQGPPALNVFFWNIRQFEGTLISYSVLLNIASIPHVSEDTEELTSAGNARIHCECKVVNCVTTYWGNSGSLDAIVSHCCVC